MTWQSRTIRILNHSDLKARRHAFRFRSLPYGARKPQIQLSLPSTDWFSWWSRQRDITPTPPSACSLGGSSVGPNSSSSHSLATKLLPMLSRASTLAIGAIAPIACILPIGRSDRRDDDRREDSEGLFADVRKRRAPAISPTTSTSTEESFFLERDAAYSTRPWDNFTPSNNSQRSAFLFGGVLVDPPQRSYTYTTQYSHDNNREEPALTTTCVLRASDDDESACLSELSEEPGERHRHSSQKRPPSFVPDQEFCPPDCIIIVRRHVQIRMEI